MHGWARGIPWPAVTRLAGGNFPASILTLLVLWQLDLNSAAARSLVNIVLSFALMLTAASLLFRKAIMEKLRQAHALVANQMTWRAPLRLVVARKLTSLTSKPASPSRLVKAGCGPDDHTASMPPGRSARRMAFNPFGS